MEHCSPETELGLPAAMFRAYLCDHHQKARKPSFVTWQGGEVVGAAGCGTQPPANPAHYQS